MTLPNPRERLLILAAVIGVHVVVLATLVVYRTAQRTLATPLPMFVAFLEQRAPEEAPPPPLRPEIRVELPQAIFPDLTLTVAEAGHAPTVAPATPLPPVPALRVAEPIIQARFDADYLNNPSPAYPPISRRLREQGLVVLKVKVRSDGSAETVEVNRTSGSLRLDDAALAAVKRWKFVPAKRGDEPIESWVLVPIEFELKA